MLENVSKKLIEEVMEDSKATSRKKLPKTGFRSIFEWKMSPLFVRSNSIVSKIMSHDSIYNAVTVSSSAIIIDNEGQGIFYERTFNHKDNYWFNRLLGRKSSKDPSQKVRGGLFSKYTYEDKSVSFKLE